VRLDGEEWPAAFAVRTTPHDVGLADLLATAQLAGMWPERLALHGAQPDSTSIGTALSMPVAAALDSLVDQVVAELIGWREKPIARALGRPPRRPQPETLPGAKPFTQLGPADLAADGLW
jgi:Hydrogenase maturation protease